MNDLERFGHIFSSLDSEPIEEFNSDFKDLLRTNFEEDCIRLVEKSEEEENVMLKESNLITPLDYYICNSQKR